MERLDIKEVRIARLSYKYKDILTDFDCVNKDENLKERGFRNKKIRKFMSYSENINNFLKSEAMDEQEKGLSTTFLLLKEGNLLGFISLCNDNIGLAIEEKKEASVPYTNVPSLKIARLAIDKNYQNNSLGKVLIEFAISTALMMRQFSGVKFLTVDCYEHRLSYYRDKIGFKVNANQNPDRQPDNPLSLRLDIDKYLSKVMG